MGEMAAGGISVVKSWLTKESLERFAEYLLKDERVRHVWDS